MSNTATIIVDFEFFTYHSRGLRDKSSSRKKPRTDDRAGSKATVSIRSIRLATFVYRNTVDALFALVFALLVLASYL